MTTHDGCEASTSEERKKLADALESLSSRINDGHEANCSTYTETRRCDCGYLQAILDIVEPADDAAKMLRTGVENEEASHRLVEAYGALAGGIIATWEAMQADVQMLHDLREDPWGKLDEVRRKLGLAREQPQTVTFESPYPSHWEHDYAKDCYVDHVNKLAVTNADLVSSPGGVGWTLSEAAKWAGQDPPEKPVIANPLETYRNLYGEKCSPKVRDLMDGINEAVEQSKPPRR